MLKKLLVAVACLWLSATSVALADPPTPANLSIKGGETAPLTVTTASTSVQLPAPIQPFGAIVFFNDGANEAFVAVGTSSVTAAVNVNAVPAGGFLTLYATYGNNYAAAITASGSTTVRVMQFTGAPPIGGYGSGSGGNVPPGGGNPFTFQVTITAAGTAQQLPSHSGISWIYCKAPEPGAPFANSGTIFFGYSSLVSNVGNGSGTGPGFIAGETYTDVVSNSNQMV